MFTREDLLRALGDCVVPALRRDVVQANLVRSASVELDREAPGTGIRGVPERYVARVVLSAPGGEEVVNAQLRAAVENRLLGMPEISRAEVTMAPPLFPILNLG
jgi:hypothetical protein